MKLEFQNRIWADRNLEHQPAGFSALEKAIIVGVSTPISTLKQTKPRELKKVRQVSEKQESRDAFKSQRYVGKLPNWTEDC